MNRPTSVRVNFLLAARAVAMPLRGRERKAHGSKDAPLQKAGGGERSASEGGPYTRVDQGKFDALAHGINAFRAHTHAITEMPFELTELCAAATDGHGKPCPYGIRASAARSAAASSSEGDNGVV